ncbi:inositol-tetrakisphosphate 1-kinase 5-like [Iris pallida]|uniref:inositol-1,3,4-trisphosphate 5/6-kinase n=1 Tax=Iris pallida TaxID=29817 RepID=A0AAX6IDK2_IRIPA|nr:inositol-tetrakisphosphate 1-kinase 5-like [Iris pallida]
MLEFVSRIAVRPDREQIVPDINTLNNHHHTIGIPKQITINDSAALEDPAVLSGLRFPVLAKPLRADGSNDSHKMALVFNSEALLKQPIPVVLQEFVNHGGVVLKVYVAGDYVTCVKRPSIRDISEEMMVELSKKGSLSFSLISNMTAGHELDEADTPPMSFITEIAQGLRRAMGLTLFNFDMIKDLRLANHYLVIDINYFPGYEKIPDYETVMTDFMWNIIHEKKEQDVSSSILGNGDEKGKPLCCDRSEEEETVG